MREPFTPGRPPNASEPAEPATVRELVGRFEDRERFQAAIAELEEAGFARADMSMLSSHETLDETEGEPHTLEEDESAALSSEAKYIIPLSTAGLIAIVGGPISAAFAGLVAAGIGGLALSDYLEKLAAVRRPDAFADAVASGGLILWVRIPDDEAEARARAIMTAHGAKDVHDVERNPA